LERNPDGFNGSQSIGLQCPNKRHRPCSLFLIHHHAARPVQIPGQSFLAWKPSGRLPTARNQTRFATFLAAVETSLSEANASLPPETGPPITDWLMVSPRKRLIIACLPQCIVPGTNTCQRI
jgi:hypothetical protein